MAQYGADRLNVVLAVEVANNSEGFSAESNAWASSIFVPSGIKSSEIRIPTAVIDDFIDCMRETMDKLEKAAAYILETSARETISGHYVIYANDVPAEILTPELFATHIDAIVEILSEYGAVLDIEVIDGAIDMVMGLAYCPNYEPFPEEVDEYPDDREIEDPLATRGEGLLQKASPELNESELNLAAWLAVTESSRFKWVEDEIYRLNGRGIMYYTGGEDGIYMRIGKDGTLEAGKYEGAFPHIGEAFFKPVVTKNYQTFSDGFTAAMEAGGKQFLVDMFSNGEPQPLFEIMRGAAAEDKPSVMKQIRDAQTAPKPHKDKGSALRKNKNRDEL